MRRAVERLEIPWPVAIDTDLEVWNIYGNQGWPARYLWDPELALYSMHYGEGAYEETEREIQALLGVEREPLAPLRPEDAPDALIAAQTEDVSGPYSGPVRGGRRVGRRRRRGRRCASTAACSRSPSRAASRSSSTAATREASCRSSPAPAWSSTPPASHRAGLSPRDRGRRAGARARGGPSSSTITAVPGKYGESFGFGREEVRLVGPGAGVDDARAVRRRPLGRVVARATGRSGASGPTITCAARDVEPLDHRAEAASGSRGAARSVTGSAAAGRSRSR